MPFRGDPDKSLIPLGRRYYGGSSSISALGGAATRSSDREWTTEGRLRHAYYLCIREDKDASDVRREAVHLVGSRPARPP